MIKINFHFPKVIFKSWVTKDSKWYRNMGFHLGWLFDNVGNVTLNDFFLKIIILTDTGENVQKWTRVFSTRRWVILVARTRRKKGEDNGLSNFGRFRLWTSFESASVSVKRSFEVTYQFWKALFWTEFQFFELCGMVCSDFYFRISFDEFTGRLRTTGIETGPLSLIL